MNGILAVVVMSQCEPISSTFAVTTLSAHLQNLSTYACHIWVMCVTHFSSAHRLPLTPSSMIVIYRSSFTQLIFCSSFCAQQTWPLIGRGWSCTTIIRINFSGGLEVPKMHTHTSCYGTAFQTSTPTTTLRLLRAHWVGSWFPIPLALNLTPAYAASSLARG